MIKVNYFTTDDTSIETVKVSLNIIKERLSKNNNTSSKGKIIVATVQVIYMI